MPIIAVINIGFNSDNILDTIFLTFEVSFLIFYSVVCVEGVYFFSDNLECLFPAFNYFLH